MTDFRDAIHIASVFRTDQVIPSYIPARDIRDLRELCRYRKKLTNTQTAEKNRFQNTMTVSQLRLDSVFTDPFGRSAMDIVNYLLEVDPDEVDDEEILRMVRKNVKASSEEILEAIHGYEFFGVQRDKMLLLREHLDVLKDLIREIDEKLDYYRDKYAFIIEHLVTIPGITENSALYILGEIGADMSIWETDAKLAAWAGLSPANNSSADKKKSTRIGCGGQYLKPVLVQCALGAVKSIKNPYFRIKYEMLLDRCGKKKAIIAVARKMLICIYHMILNDEDFHPADYDRVVNGRKEPRKMNMDKIFNYLRKQGVDEETIEIIEKQCLAREEEKVNGLNEGSLEGQETGANAEGNLSGQPGSLPGGTGKPVLADVNMQDNEQGGFSPGDNRSASSGKADASARETKTPKEAKKTPVVRPIQAVTNRDGPAKTEDEEAQEAQAAPT